MKTDTDKHNRILGSLEDLFYSLCLLAIFYPWYLIRIVIFPSRILSRYADSVENDSDQEDLVSPPVLFVTSAAIAAVFFRTSAESSDWLFSSLAHLFSNDALYVRIATGSATFVMFAIVNALFVEYLTPGAVRRDSFRLPLYANLLAASPFLIGLTAASVMIDVAVASQTIGMYDWIGLLLVFAAFGWYFRAQVLLYRRLANTSGWKALGFTVLSICIIIFVTEAIGYASPK